MIFWSLDRYFDTDIITAKECLERYKRFLKNTENIIKFTNHHQYIPGFQISEDSDDKGEEQKELVLDDEDKDSKGSRQVGGSSMIAMYL